MDEDLETEDMNPELAALSGNYPELAGKDPSEVLRELTARQFTNIKQQRAAREKVSASKRAAFEAGLEEIKQRRYGAPTPSQQLYALSAALLSPRSQPGIAGTLANVVPALGEMSKLQSSAESQRAEAEQRLRQQYTSGTDAAMLAGLEAETEALKPLISAYGSLAKPRVPRIVGPAVIDGIPHQGEQDPATGEVRWTPINPAGQGTPQLTAPQRKALTQLQTYISNPDVPEAQKQVALKNFQRQFRVNPLDYLKGAM